MGVVSRRYISFVENMVSVLTEIDGENHYLMVKVEEVNR